MCTYCQLSDEAFWKSGVGLLQFETKRCPQCEIKHIFLFPCWSCRLEVGRRANDPSPENKVVTETNTEDLDTPPDVPLEEPGSCRLEANSRGPMLRLEQRGLKQKQVFL